MKVASINSFPKHTAFKSDNNQQSPKLTDIFYTKIRNTADMTDTVAVPRSIFKGYLGFTAGTALTSLAMAFKSNKYANRTLNVFGTLGIIYGTFSFVRPYIFKNVNGVSAK